MQTQAMIMTSEILVMFVILVITAMLFARISEFLKVPDVVLYLLAGIMIGPSMLNLVSIDHYPLGNQLILTFGSAFILYEGGREVKLRVLNDIKTSVSLLSTLGVVISAAVVGFAAIYIFKIPMIYGLLLGAVVASTDPATLVPVFKKIKIKERVKQTVISESAFNDAVGAILVVAILAVINSGTFSITANLKTLGVMIFGGIAVGVAVGVLFSILISDTKYGYFHDFAPILSLVTVATSFVLAEELGGSGYMATFVTGLICGNKKVFKLWVPETDFVSQMHFRETVALLMRMSIFVLLGTHVDFVSLAKYWQQSLVFVLLLMLVARPISVLICTLPDRKVKWSSKELMFIMWVRETGVIPAALSSIIVAMKMPYSDIISSAVFMTILVTLLIQASTTKMFADKLGLLGPNEDLEREKKLKPLLG